MGELVSVIVPVYNTRKYLNKCLDSILGQTYRYIEVIIVNDGSCFGEEEIIIAYEKKDSRVRYLKNKKNLGLYKTRINGVKIARGKYIAFVDSDDYISVDFIRNLYYAAQKNDADITFASTVINTPDEQKNIFTLQDTMLNMLPLESKELKKEYFRQGGQSYIWHTIWNKLYTRRVWNKVLPILESLNGHIVMTEDLAFSSIIFLNANKAICDRNAVYFYCKHEDASTSNLKNEIGQYEKKVHDISETFTFILRYIKENAIEYEDDFNGFREYYSRLYHRSATLFDNPNEREHATNIADNFYKANEKWTIQDDGYFMSVQTPYNDSLEKIKNEIVNGEEKIISFDIFDTLVCRPFYKPTDMFYLLDEEYRKISGETSANSFYVIRKEAEQGARQCLHKGYEDLSIEDIYWYINEYYGIHKEICNHLLKHERELEIRFCKTRQTGYDLYSLAKDIGKTTIIVSDMYLDRYTIEKILEKNNITGYSKLYLSSDTKLLKSSGSMYRFILDDLKIAPREILHIGDNAISDVEIPAKYGIHCCLLPNPIKVFSNSVDGLKTSASGNIIRKAVGKYRSAVHTSFEEISGFGTMSAMVAVKYFDNPFRGFHPMSDFNCDPYYIGYYALGMSLMGQIEWIISLSKKRKIRKIIFTARDGYLLYKSCKIYENYIRKLPFDIEYKYVSRRAIMPALIRTQADFMCLPIVYTNYSPKMIIKLLKFAANTEKCNRFIKENHYDENRKFVSIKEYHNFMQYFISELYDKNKHMQAKALIEEYWQGLSDDDAIFDMGYSASIHGGICHIVNKHPLALFIHTDADKHIHNQKIDGFEIETLFDFIPSVSSIMMEYLYSDTNGSCIGYIKEGEKVTPVIEKLDKNYADVFPIMMMQRGALNFLRDFYHTMGLTYTALDYRIQDIEMPIEALLSVPSKLDTKVFGASYFEDKVYGARAKINARSFWLQKLMQNDDMKTDIIDAIIKDYMEQNNKKEIVFFGAGKMCRKIINYYSTLHVDRIYDNDKNKEGELLGNCRVRKPSAQTNWNECFIVIVCEAYQEIEIQLNSYGLNKYSDYVTALEVF